jgi:membrane protease YdiL (CAAX protease family)
MNNTTDGTTAPAPAKGGLENVFVGSRGLRAGWGVLLYLAFILLIATAILFLIVGVNVLILHHTARPGIGAPSTPEAFDISELLTIVPFLGAAAIMALIEKRSLAAYGFSLKGALPRFAQGLVAGLLLLALLVGVLQLTGGIGFDRVALNGSDAWTWGLRWALTFLLVGVAEEVALRGYLLQTLARGLNFRWAAAITSALFVAPHLYNPGEGLMGWTTVLLVGLVFCLSIWRTGTLWWAIGFHAAWDWAQSFLFGVPNSGLPAKGALLVTHPTGPAWLSGGNTGPEGSALTIPILALTCGVILWTQKTRDYALAAKA